MGVLCFAHPGLSWPLLPNDAEEGVADLDLECSEAFLLIVDQLGQISHRSRFGQ